MPYIVTTHKSEFDTLHYVIRTNEHSDEDWEVIRTWSERKFHGHALDCARKQAAGMNMLSMLN